MLSRQPTLDEQKRFWDWHWQHWEDRRTVNEWKKRRHEAVLSFISSLSLNKPLILDVGCGPGWYTNNLSQFGRVTGIDLSAEAINMARSRFPHITFMAGNLYEDSLPAAHFDLVVSQEIIDHVEDSSAFVDKVARVLKPGGYLVVSSTNRFVVERLAEHEFPAQPSAHIGRYMDRAGLKRLLSRHFSVMRLETIIPLGHRGIFRITNSYKLNELLGIVISKQFLDRLKERAGFGYQIIALAQKKTAL